MKAIIVENFGLEKVMKIKEIQPYLPGPDQAAVNIKTAGVNPVDTYIRSGTYAKKPALPYTPGNDGAGVIHEVGSAVTSFKKGDRVYLTGSLTGSYAENAICAENQLHHLPDNVSFESGSCLGTPYPTAYRALIQKTKAQQGEWLLIHGATGGVGLAAVQIAVSKGVKVIATGGTKKGRQLVKEQGVEFVLDHNSNDYLDLIKEITQGAGVNIVLEMLANVNLSNDLKILSKYGRVIVIGNRGDVTITPRDAMVKDASIIGMMLSNTLPDEMLEIHEGLKTGLINGSLKPVISLEFPLEEAAAAHRKIISPGAEGNIILTI